MGTEDEGYCGWRPEGKKQTSEGVVTENFAKSSKEEGIMNNSTNTAGKALASSSVSYSSAHITTWVWVATLS